MLPFADSPPVEIAVFHWLTSRDTFHSQLAHALFLRTTPKAGTKIRLGAKRQQSPPQPPLFFASRVAVTVSLGAQGGSSGRDGVVDGGSDLPGVRAV